MKRGKKFLTRSDRAKHYANRNKVKADHRAKADLAMDIYHGYKDREGRLTEKGKAKYKLSDSLHTRPFASALDNLFRENISG